MYIIKSAGVSDRKVSVWQLRSILKKHYRQCTVRVHHCNDMRILLSFTLDIDAEGSITSSLGRYEPPAPELIPAKPFNQSNNT